jgi:hypothetical protein
MSEGMSTGGALHDLDYRSAAPGAGGGRSLVKIGGALGVAATMIGFAIFVVGCFGFAAVYPLAIIPLVLSVVGFGLVLAGGFFQTNVGVDDMAVVASYILTLAGIAGAGLLVAVWQGWPIFYR